MKQLTYTINDPLGIHARPAGMLVKLAKGFVDTDVTINKDDKTAKATQMMKIMGLGIKKGDKIVLTAEGPSEDEAIAEIQKFLEETL